MNEEGTGTGEAKGAELVFESSFPEAPLGCFLEEFWRHVRRFLI